MQEEDLPFNENEDFNLDESEAQLALFRERIQEAKALPQYKTDTEFQAAVKELEDASEGLETAIAQKISENLLQEIKVDKAMEEGDKAYNNMREELMNAILDNPENMDQWIKMAREIIGVEKLHDLHNPADWQRIAHLLPEDTTNS